MHPAEHRPNGSTSESVSTRRDVEKNDPKGLPRDKIERIQNVPAALIQAPDMDGVDGPPGWRTHQLRGERAGHWSISVSGNWRLTFRIEDGAIADLDLEDYH